MTRPPLSLFLALWVALLISLTSSSKSIFDKTDLPRLADTDSIELYHLRSFPAQLIDTAAGTFSTQTSGLALRSTTTNQVIVLEYKPKSFSGCFLPIIESMEEGSYSLYWDKRAELVYHDQLDTVYWQQSTFLAHINGIVYKNYVLWIERYMQTNRVFSPQSICSNEHDFSCYTYAETWETFLQESLKVFAAFSVRIHAIIPPRATELRMLSSNLPVIVEATNLPPENRDNAGTGDYAPRRRFDNGGESTKNSPQTRKLSSDSGGALRRDGGNVVNEKKGDGRDDSVARGPVEPWVKGVESDTASASKVDIQEVVDYYQSLMSCMQDFQLQDFTNALKSCVISNRKAYVHISGNKYYAFMPRYPLVFINEYLQEIPEPLFNDITQINVFDSVILAFLLLIAVVGCGVMMYRMNILFCQVAYHGCGVWTQQRSISKDNYGEMELDDMRSPSKHSPFSPQGRKSTFSRLWGAVGWRKPSYAYDHLESGHELHDEEESVELMRMSSDR
eukprot:gene3470-3801_t